MQTQTPTIGMSFGRWQIVGDASVLKAGKRAWHCKCECGRVALVDERQLSRGKSRSCGCNRFGAADCGRVLGKGRRGITPTSSTWRAMMRRCYYPKNGNYSRYGAKGVTVCERWHEYANFVADMGERPAGTTIDRIDNAKGYEPGNCRWATRAQQTANKTRDGRKRKSQE